MVRRFDKEAVRREIESWMLRHGLFDLIAIYAATKTKGSALYGLIDEPTEVFDLLERAYGEDNIGYSKKGVGLILNKEVGQ